MMQEIRYPERKQWDEILKRPSADDTDIRDSVAGIIRSVKEEGDAALRRFSRQYDGFETNIFEIERQTWLAAEADLSTALKDAIDTAIENIRCFHAARTEEIKRIQTMPGITCWRKSVPVDKVGLYVPGGTAPLFSTLLMLAIPASLAGCNEIIVCTPAGKDGAILPAVLYAAAKTGVTRLFALGGAQAIAAMAYGTESVPKVYKIFGPGNRYVTCAKMLLSAEGMAIDMPAGPSELAVLADDSCIPAFVAADLLSQAEHGTDSQVLLVTDSEEVIRRVDEELATQLERLPRRAIAVAALNNSKAILVNNLEEGMELLNEYAPEHLIIACCDTVALSAQVRNAGSVFLGNYAPESAGDYASGTNHTLPTGGFAKAYSGVSLDSFVKKITFQQLTEEGLQQIAPTIENMALAEGLFAHANAVTIRTKICSTNDNI
ncbi:histidinol dehydrogenase [Chitinophagaceae bacterium MMS25-I14]